jgi:hypothetical protein
VASCCECGDEPLGSCAMELVSFKEKKKLSLKILIMILICVVLKVSFH